MESGNAFENALTRFARFSAMYPNGRNMTLELKIKEIIEFILFSIRKREVVEPKKRAARMTIPAERGRPD
jgi:hypothetical protein